MFFISELQNGSLSPKSLLNKYTTSKDELAKARDDLQQKQKNFDDLQENSLIPSILSYSADSRSQIQELKKNDSRRSYTTIKEYQFQY